jgi:hypothetical protein
MPEPARNRLSAEELLAEAGTALPAKEVISLLDVNVDLDLALALAAPIDLAVAANANVALPIDAAVSANVLSILSSSAAVANQGVLIDQLISGEAIAEATQVADVDQGGENGADDGAEASAATIRPLDVEDTVAADDDGEVVDGLEDVVGDVVDGVDGVEDVVDDVDDAVEDVVDDLVDDLDDTVGDVVDDVVDGITDELGAAAGLDLYDGLLNLDVKVALDADLAAPIAGAVAANANVAAPIDAAVAANVGSIGSEAIAIADQTAIITQRLEDVTAHAIADQDASVEQ